MDAGTVEPSERLRSASEQFVGTLQDAANGRFDIDQLTALLKVAFTQRNRIDAAVSSAIGALDRAAAKAPDGELTAGLSSVENGYQAPAELPR
jgi:hypothetical protein